MAEHFYNYNHKRRTLFRFYHTTVEDLSCNTLLLNTFIITRYWRTLFHLQHTTAEHTCPCPFPSCNYRCPRYIIAK